MDRKMPVMIGKPPLDLPADFVVELRIDDHRDDDPGTDGQRERPFEQEPADVDQASDG